MVASRTGLIVVTAAALATFAAADAFLDVADVLRDDVERVLVSVQADRSPAGFDESVTRGPDGSLTFTIVDGPPTGVARGMQLALIALFLGGIPAAVVALGLTAMTKRRRIRWNADWSGVFFAGYVFQMGSLVVTLPMLALFVVPVLLLDWPAEPISALVGGIAVADVLAIPCWLRLRASAVDDPVYFSLFASAPAPIRSTASTGR